MYGVGSPGLAQRNKNASLPAKNKNNSMSTEKDRELGIDKRRAWGRMKCEWIAEHHPKMTWAKDWLSSHPEESKGEEPGKGATE